MRHKSIVSDCDQEKDKLVKDCKAKDTIIATLQQENAQLKSKLDQALSGPCCCCCRLIDLTALAAEKKTVKDLQDSMSQGVLFCPS